MNKNDVIIDSVSRIGMNGEGIVIHDGKTVFVPFSLPGEKIKFKILKVDSKIAYGKLLEVFTPSECRVRPKCKVFEKCGGCQLQHMGYSTQLKVKEDAVRSCFKKIAGLDVDVQPTVKCNNAYGYRNKLQLPVQLTKDGTKIGFYAENSHRVVPISDCPINPDWTSKIIDAFEKYINEFKIRGYNLDTCDGELREIAVKEAGGNLIITEVVTDVNIRGTDKLIEILKQELKCEFSLYLNVNNSNSNVIYGKDYILKYGKPEYYIETRGIKHKIGVRSFIQVNNEIALKLYSFVKEIIGNDKDAVLINAYSGAGFLTALLAKSVKRAIGIEIVEEAVNCANQLCIDNGLENITNFMGKTEDIMPDIIEKENACGNKIFLILDPPRKGCDINVIKTIIENPVEKIVYISCKPSTLARDVGLITGTLEYVDGEIRRADSVFRRYEVKFIKPFDMFPQTKHVETLVCLSKKNGKTYQH